MDKITEKIIIRFVNRKKKNEIQKKCKNLRGKKVFINEHLTKRNEELAYMARNFKKKKAKLVQFGQGTVKSI